jgi:glutathione synthase/RimK-type ligase-like ATP-grasp enzyme
VALALKASARMGEGLYGVDIKERGGRFYVIEVNDNPDIHHAFEASRPSDRVWSRIAGWFAQRAIDRAVPAAA